MNYGEYATVSSVRSAYLDSTQSSDDALILKIVRQVSREISEITNRKFYPRIETHYFDTPIGADLYLDDDLLEMTALTNGDGNTIAVSEYKLYPLNLTPKEKITLLATSGKIWSTAGDGSDNGAISLAGVWGCHDDYANAWQDTGAVLSAGITGTATSFTVGNGLVQAGQMLAIDDEYLYARTAVSGDTSDTITVIRGVNGSTAAAHESAAVVMAWQPGYEIEMLAAQAVAAYYRLRSNPGMETVMIDGAAFSTPKDVHAYMRKRLESLGLLRLGLA